jgi:hypothetical protein
MAFNPGGSAKNTGPLNTEKERLLGGAVPVSGVVNNLIRRRLWQSSQKREVLGGGELLSDTVDDLILRGLSQSR